jgi:hypothetical protein
MDKEIEQSLSYLWDSINICSMEYPAGEESRNNIWRKIDWKPSKFDEKHQDAQKTPSRKKKLKEILFNVTIAWNIISKLPKNKDQESGLWKNKAAHHIPLNWLRLTADFFSEIIKSRQ